MPIWILGKYHQRKENKMSEIVKDSEIHSFSLIKDYHNSDPVLQTNITCPNIENACQILLEIEQIVTKKKQTQSSPSRCC